MSLEIDFTPYAEHFRKLKKSRAKIKVFGKKYTLNELRAKAKAIAEPKNPVNDKKLPQKKGFSTNVVYGKNGKKRLLQRIYDSNIDALLRAFPDVVPPAWFVKNRSMERLVTHLLAFNVLEVVECVPEPKKEAKQLHIDPRFALSRPYVPPNYF